MEDRPQASPPPPAGFALELQNIEEVAALLTAIGLGIGLLQSLQLANTCVAKDLERLKQRTVRACGLYGGAAVTHERHPLST